MSTIPPALQNLPGLRTVYDDDMLRLALAIAEMFIAKGLGSGGGGGGGDASSANQLTEIARLEAIRDRLPTVLVSDRLKIDGSGVTQPISATSLPLPTGAATDSVLQSVRDRLMPAGTTTSYIGTSAGANLKTSSGAIHSITCSNLSSEARYFQVFNKASAPINGDVPVRSYTIFPTPSLLIIGQDVIGGSGIILSTGIAWGFSTTPLTYTAGTATDCIATVRWT
ncbi:hypothetical protein PCC6912_39500 [Chlorogloeopsis fritschii PCC 6912]|uniref:Uncharacterized protein n=1 Tax=Chlorogloeopsis fritschii PCC 6912 TaxID=211165 RepID=A0A3S0ZPQ4_CHLFR|nr:hypothetical protein [Chlorogloeopsis fritschii]RUR76991.1 hypothetical protein PCC6912_39500 [Chlorogloeopsis fritschii PCC 6912]